jgi:hypothetical protein
MRTRDNLIIDATVLAIYLLAANPSITGYSTHEWVSVAFGATALVHLALHGDWVVRSVRGLLGRIAKRSRVFLLLDTLTAVAVTAVMVSGIAVSRTISGALGLAWTVTPFWQVLHASSATAVLMLALAHLAVHRRWIVTACRLHVVAPLQAAFSEQTRTPPASARAIAIAIPALLVASVIGLVALGVSGSVSTTTGTTTAVVSTSTGQTLTCPRTGCTASTCHATSGQQGGGSRGFGG